MDALTNAPGPLRFGSFELDVRSRELRTRGSRLRLQKQPFEILRMMLERPGDVITRDELRQRLWPDGTFVDYEHSLNAAVKHFEHGLLGPEFSVEELIQFARTPHLHRLKSHHRPRGNREEDQNNDDDLRLGRGLFPNAESSWIG